MNNFLSNEWKVRLISWGNTFATAFILSIVAAISVTGAIEWTTAFWISIVMTGVRAGLAEIVKTFTPVRLGGRKEV